MTENMMISEYKRRDVLIRIGQAAVGVSIAGAVPTPALELAKSLGIAAADAWLIWDIYEAYYDESPSVEKITNLLGEAGIIIFAGGVIGYGAVKVSQALISEFLNIVPIIGWALAGVMNGATTMTIGLVWMAFLEERQYSVRKADESTVNTFVAIPIHRTEPDVKEAVAEDDEPLTILTLHPQGKQGTNIDKAKYDLIRDAIIRTMKVNDGEMQLQALNAAIEDELSDQFDGSVRWYVTTTKLDLEARNIIERVPKSSPQKLRLV